MSYFYPGKLLPAIILFIFSFHLSNAQISTFAGRRFYLGDNGPATGAALFGPYAFTRDSSGNLYIVTNLDNHVRKVDNATQVITEIAGTGIAGFTGDGGPGTSAQLNLNNGLPGAAVDNAGNIYIGDYVNNRIRRIDAVTGVITTYAGSGTGGYTGDGGPAVSARLNGPAGMVLDGAGNLYFADNNNSVIRRVDAVTKIITTYVGAAAGLSYPECITMDKKGNLYIADELNNLIRKVDAGTQAVTTVAGSGAHGYSGDGGLATSAALGYVMGIAVDSALNLYIVDQSNNRIRKVNASTKIITTIAGTGAASFAGDGGLATSAQVNTPTSIQVDLAGNVYIDDYKNNRIRKITASTNIISTIAGDGSTGFTGVPKGIQAQLNPQAVAIDASGNVFIGDGYYYDVRIVNISSNSYNYAGVPNPDYKYASKGYGGNGSYATSALYNTPFGVAVDASNNVYIADVFNNVIRKVAYSTKFVTTVAGTNVAGYSGDGAAATAAKLNNPYGIAIDKNGNLYIADALNNAIRKVTAATQAITTVAGNGTAGFSGDGSAATSATLNNPHGVAVDTAGNVFILDWANKKIRMVTAATQKISTIFSNGHALTGVATDVKGNVFVSDSTAGTVIRLTAKTYTDSLVAGTGTPGYADNASSATSGQLNYPAGLAVTSTGEVLVADVNNNVIRKFKPAATATATPLGNNIASTTDSIKTCTGSISLTTLSGTAPTGGSGSYTYSWLKSTNGSTWATFSGNSSQNCTINSTINTTTYYRRLVTSGAYADSGNVLTFKIFTNPTPVIVNSGANTICKGVKDTLSTSVAYSSYLWSTNAVTSKIVDTLSGTFSVTVTDANSCKGTSANITIKVNALPAKPTITSSPVNTTNLCTSTSVTLTSSSALKYKWSTGATTQAITFKTAGSYTVMVTDANSCSNTSSAKTVSYKACAVPASPVAASVTSVQATLTWKTVPCAVKYRLQYALYGTTSWTTVITTANDTFYVVPGLAKNTKYQWQVSSVCDESPLVTSAYSSVKTFKTTASLMPAASEEESLKLDEGFGATLYPNPVVSRAILHITAEQGKAAVTITDMSGRTMWQTVVTGDKQLNLPTEQFAAGMYLVTIRDDKNKKVIKLIKQ